MAVIVVLFPTSKRVEDIASIASFSNTTTTKEALPLYHPREEETDRRGLDCPLVGGTDDLSSNWKSHIKYVVTGTQKGGTTFLYSVLTEHPRILPNVRKETHCYDWDWHPNDPNCRSGFYPNKLVKNANLISGDVSPSYLWNTELVIPRILNAFPCVKIIASLRNPIDRYYSQMKMFKVNHKFDEMVLSGMNQLYTAGLLPHWQMTSDKRTENLTLLDYVAAKIDLDVFSQFHGSREELEAWKLHKQIAERPPECSTTLKLLTPKCSQKLYEINAGSVSRGIYSIQLARWLQFFPRDRVLVLKFEDFQNPLGLNRTLVKLYNFLDLPFQAFPSDSDHSGHIHYKERMTETAYQVLQKLYEPYNAKLAQVLGDDEWKNPW